MDTAPDASDLIEQIKAVIDVPTIVMTEVKAKSEPTTIDEKARVGTTPGRLTPPVKTSLVPNLTMQITNSSSQLAHNEDKPEQAQASEPVVFVSLPKQPKSSSQQNDVNRKIAMVPDSATAASSRE